MVHNYSITSLSLTMDRPPSYLTRFVKPFCQPTINHFDCAGHWFVKVRVLTRNFFQGLWTSSWIYSNVDVTTLVAIADSYDLIYLSVSTVACDLPPFLLVYYQHMLCLELSFTSVCLRILKDVSTILIFLLFPLLIPFIISFFRCP